MTALPGRPARRILISSVASVAGVVLLLSLKPHSTAGATASAATAPTASAPSSAASADPSPSPSASSSGSPSASPGTSSSPSTSSPSAGTSATTRTVDGDTVRTRYGPVQLRVTLTGGRITAVTALQLPSDNPRDEEISGFAVPQLTQEALTAQSARIDTVSGATYTSDGYVQSLQSALDKAGV